MRSASASLKGIGTSMRAVLRGSLAVEQRVFYLDAEEGPQTEGETIGREMVRLPVAVRRRLPVHRHRQGRGPPPPAAQRRDRLPVHPQPPAGRRGLPGGPRQPKPGLEAGGGDQGPDPAAEGGADPAAGGKTISATQGGNGMTADDLAAAVGTEAANELTGARGKIKHCLGQLSDEQVWGRSRPSLNSIGNLVLHLCGNVRQGVVAGLGGAADRRDRPAEFAE